MWQPTGRWPRALGNRLAARWVGQYLRQHKHDAACPCHRVVQASGTLGSCAMLTSDKMSRRLAAEGVEVVDGRIDLPRFGFRGFVSDRPLARLREVQEAVAKKVVVAPRNRIPRTVGGVDLSYPSPEEAVAAYTLVDVESGQLLWFETLRHPVIFPYIVSYLTFREVPVMVALLDAVRVAGRLAEVVLVDGSGILHQRHVGKRQSPGRGGLGADDRRDQKPLGRPGRSGGDAAGRVAARLPSRARHWRRGSVPPLAVAARSLSRPGMRSTWRLPKTWCVASCEADACPSRFTGPIDSAARGRWGIPRSEQRGDWHIFGSKICVYSFCGLVCFPK